LIVQFNEVERDPALLRLIDRLCSAHAQTSRCGSSGQVGSIVRSWSRCLRAAAFRSIAFPSSPIRARCVSALLEELAVGVFEERHDGVLQFPNVQRVRSLSIGDRLRKDWDLSPLADFCAPRQLILTSQHRTSRPSPTCPSWRTSAGHDQAPGQSGLRQPHGSGSGHWACGLEAEKIWGNSPMRGYSGWNSSG
jgi:hypothetical protein